MPAYSRKSAASTFRSVQEELKTRRRRAAAGPRRRAALVALALTTSLIALSALFPAPLPAAAATVIPSFTFAPTNPLSLQPVAFTSTSTATGNAVITSQAWDLDGDGTFETPGPTAARSFPRPGKYTVRLRVVDDRNAVSVATAIVMVADRSPPVVILQAAPRPARLLMTPFPIVRISGVFAHRGIRLRLLTVQAPRGARVDLLCDGHGCPFRRHHRTVATGSSQTRTLRFRQFRRHTLRIGTTLRVLVSDRSAIGKYTRFSVRRSVPPLRLDRCLPPGARSPVACPRG